MNREDFIIHVYCLICDEYAEISREQRLRRGGFAPAFTDEEVMTVEICGECFGLNEETELGPVPSGWKVKQLDEVATVNGKSISKGYPFQSIEYVDISSVANGALSGTTLYDLSEAPSRARRIVQHGDTIWSTVRPNRRSYLLIHSPIQNLIVSTGFAILTPNLVPPAFLYQWVTTDEFVDYLTSNADGSAYPAVSADRFSAAKLICPTPSVLSHYHELVMPMYDLMNHNSVESRTLAELRDTLLPKLMSGELRVPVGAIWNRTITSTNRECAVENRPDIQW